MQIVLFPVPLFTDISPIRPETCLGFPAVNGESSTDSRGIGDPPRIPFSGEHQAPPGSSTSGSWLRSLPSSAEEFSLVTPLALAKQETKTGERVLGNDRGWRTSQIPALQLGCLRGCPATSGGGWQGGGRLPGEPRAAPWAHCTRQSSGTSGLTISGTALAVTHR